MSKKGDRKMLQENERLKAQNAKLEAENQRLRLELELTQIKLNRASAAVGAGFEVDDRELRRVIQERDNAINEIHQIKGIIAHTYQAQRENMENAKQMADQYWSAEHNAREVSKSIFGRMVWFAFDRAQSMMENIADKKIAPKIHHQIQVTGRNDVTDNIGLTLDTIAYFVCMQSNYVISMDLASQVTTIVQNPAIAAVSVMIELRRNNKVSIELVKHFPETYLKELHGNGLSYKRLHRALERGYEAETSTYDELALKYHTSPELVKQDRQIYLKVKELADNPPEWLRTMLEFTDDESDIAS